MRRTSFRVTGILMLSLLAVAAIVALLLVPARLKHSFTLRLLYTGDTVGYLEPCG